MPTSNTGQRPKQKLDDQALLAGIALLAILGFAWAVRSCDVDGDRRAVMRQVKEIEKSLRKHDPGFWVSVEGDDSPEHPNPAQEKTHQATLRDFERLAHLDGFAMTDVDVEITGDQAQVSYHIRGVPREGETLPVGGVMRFMRRGATWRLTDGHLIEQRGTR